MSDTIKCKPWGKDQGEFVVVNKADFDPAVHEEYKEPKAAKPAAKPKAESASEQ